MTRDRLAVILRLGLPIIAGMISQNVLNLVDTAMVGTLGDAALAAVGTGAFLNFLCMALFTGASIGVQAMVSRRVGEGRAAVAAEPLNGALLLIVCVAVPWTLLLRHLAPTLFHWVNPQPEVAAVGVPYLKMRLIALAAVGMNFAFRGFFNGIKRPRYYLVTILAMHAVNICLNWVFIFGKLGAPRLGATGAALASAIAAYVGLALYFGIALWRARPNGFLARRPSRAKLLAIIRLAAPSSAQQLMFAAGMNVLFSILGKLGTQATAAANVVLQLSLIATLPCIALGITAATLVGQALGRGEPEDARRWGWQTVQVALLLIGCVGGVMILAPQLVLSGFIHASNTLHLAEAPLRLMALALIMDSIGLVLMQAIMGAGATRQTLIVSVSAQWGFFLPIAALVGIGLGYGIVGVFIVQVVYRALLAAIYARMWALGSWATARVLGVVRQAAARRS